MAQLVIAKIRLAHCKRGPAVCALCREYDLGRHCLLDVDPRGKGLMQRRVIEVKRGENPEWCEFDVVKVFATESEANRYADAEGILVLHGNEPGVAQLPAES